MQEFELSISVVVREKPGTAGGYYGNALEVRESVTVSAGSFQEAVAILGKFHDLMESAKSKP